MMIKSAVLAQHLNPAISYDSANTPTHASCGCMQDQPHHRKAGKDSGIITAPTKKMSRRANTFLLPLYQIKKEGSQYTRQSDEEVSEYGGSPLHAQPLSSEIPCIDPFVFEERPPVFSQSFHHILVGKPAVALVSPSRAPGIPYQ